MFEMRSDVTFDLLPAIDGLRALKSDLEAYYWGQPAHRGVESLQRYQISYWIRQVSDRAAALESIVMHNGTSRVRLRHVPAGEREALRVAAASLDRWVREDEPFERVLQMVALALAAADRIGLCAAGGAPDTVNPAGTGPWRSSASRTAHEPRAWRRGLELDVGVIPAGEPVVPRKLAAVRPEPRASQRQGSAPRTGDQTADEIQARPGSDAVTEGEP
jgi:hypothetical protein